MIGDDDLTKIFNNGDFDEEAIFVITPPAGTITVRGWFTDASEAASLYSGELEANDASFVCKTSDVATVKNEMTVTIRGTQYKVKRKQKTGTGVSMIVLKS